MVFRRHRFLEPADIEIGDRPAIGDRSHAVIGMVRVDHQADALADLRAHRTGRRHVVAQAEPDLQLHGGKSLRGIARRLLAQIGLVVRALAAIEPGRIGGDRHADRPAHQRMDGLPERPAGEVPQRDVDPAERLDGEALLAVIAEAGVEIFPDRLAGARVASREQLAVEPHDRRIQPRRPVDLAEAADAVLRNDLHDERPALVVPGAGIGEGRGELRAQDMCHDGSDLHRDPRLEEAMAKAKTTGGTGTTWPARPLSRSGACGISRLRAG